MKARLGGALAAALALAAGTARADDAGTGGPFSCATVFVATDGKVSVTDLFAGPPGEALDGMLQKHGLARASSAGEADLQLSFSFAYTFPGVDDAGRLRANETLTMTATVQGARTRIDTTSLTHVLASLGSHQAVGALGGYRTWGANFILMQLDKDLGAYLDGHRAGARIQTQPRGARLLLDPDAGFADDGLVVRCLAKGDPIEVTAKLDGYKDTAMTLQASEADTPAVVPLPPLATTSSASSASSSASSGSGGFDTGDAAIAAIMVAAAGGAAWAVNWLRSRGMNVPPPRLKVLFFASNPQGTQQLALDEETREIRAKLNEGTYRDLVDFVPYWAARFDDVVAALDQHRPQIVHFSGHGKPDGAIVLQGDGGAPAPLEPDVAKKLFSTFATGADRIRVVLLNACFSAEQAEAIRDVVDCTIGSTRAISDDAAVDFAAAFYRAIAFGRSVQNAYDQGLLGVAGNSGGAGATRDLVPPPDGAPDAAAAPASTITLLVRQGVDASAITFFDGAPAPVPAAARG